GVEREEAFELPGVEMFYVGIAGEEAGAQFRVGGVGAGVVDALAQRGHRSRAAAGVERLRAGVRARRQVHVDRLVVRARRAFQKNEGRTYSAPQTHGAMRTTVPTIASTDLFTSGRWGQKTLGRTSAQLARAVGIGARERPRLVEVAQRRLVLEHGHRVERQLEDVALEEQLAAGTQLAGERGGELGRDQAALAMAPLEPRIGKVDEHAR